MSDSTRNNGGLSRLEPPGPSDLDERQAEETNLRREEDRERPIRPTQPTLNQAERRGEHIYLRRTTHQEPFQDFGADLNPNANPYHADNPQLGLRNTEHLEPRAAHQNQRPQLRVKTTRATLTVASLNIRGGGSASTMPKWQNINQILRDKRIGILAVQETHLKLEQITSLHEQFSARVHIKNNSDNNDTASKGIAFVLNKQLTAWKEARTTTLVPGRATLLQIPWQKQNLTVLGVYAPNQPAQNAEFWETLREKWENGRLPTPDIMLGDFNMVEEAIDRLPAHPDTANTIASLNALKDRHSLRDGWRIFNENERGYTFKQAATQARSRIDRIYTTDMIFKNSRDWAIEPSGIHTDHYLISVKIANPGTPYVGKGRWSIPPFALENRKVTQKILERGLSMQTDIKELQNTAIEHRERGDIQKRFHRFKEEIVRDIRDFTRTEVPRMEARIKKAKEDLKRTLNEDTEDTHLVQMSANELEHLIEDLERQRHTKIRDNVQLKHKLEGECITKYWINANKEKTPRDTMHRLKYPAAPGDSEERQYARRSDQMAELARDYHEKLQSEGLDGALDTDTLDEVLGNLSTRLQNHQKHKLAEYINEEEVRAAIDTLPLGKAPGLDGIPHELWKKLAKRHDDDVAAGRPAMNIVRILCAVFNDIEKNGADESTGFSSGWMCPIYKKGDTEEIKDMTTTLQQEDQQ